MKKNLLIVISLFAVLLLTGCGKVNLDLEKVNEKLSNLTTDTISVSLVYDQVINTKGYESMEYIYDFDYGKYDFDVEDLEEYSFGLNQETKDFYLIFKPVKDEKKDVKEDIKDFVEDLIEKEKNKDIVNKLKKYTLEEEGDYLIAVASNNNKELIKAIKNAKNPLFANMMPVSIEEIETVIGVKKDHVKEFVMATPMMIVNADTYVIIKPSKGNKDAVKKAMDIYMNNLEEQWSTYLPEQYDKVKNRLEKELGDYLVYIVSSNNNLAFKTIKDCKK